MRLRQLFENINRTGEGKTAVVGWGRGMGHKGHMMLAGSVITHAKDSEGDPYFVVSRSYGPDDPLEPEEKLDIYRKVFPEQGHIFQTATDELPDLTRVLANLNQQGYTNAIIVVGADQKAAFQYLNHYNGKPDKKGNIAFDFENLQVISRQETTDPSREEEGPRATPMRAVLMDPSKSHDEQFAVWRDAMSPEIDDEEVMALMHKAQQRMTQMAAAKKPKKKQGVAEGGAETSWSHGTEKITLQDILELTNHIKQINLPINDNLKSKLIHWDGNSEEIERINQVIVSKQFPILIIVDEQGQIQSILDGNHRLHRAIKAQAKTIPAKLIKPSDLNDKAKRILHINEQGVAKDK
jgi:hypothetical protein